MVRPRYCAGTVASTNFWRSSSLEKRLIFHLVEVSLLLARLFGGPKHHQQRPPPAIERVLRHRLLLLQLPRDSVTMISKPWR